MTGKIVQLLRLLKSQPRALRRLRRPFWRRARELEL